MFSHYEHSFAYAYWHCYKSNLPGCSQESNVRPAGSVRAIPEGARALLISRTPTRRLCQEPIFIGTLTGNPYREPRAGEDASLLRGVQ